MSEKSDKPAGLLTRKELAAELGVGARQIANLREEQMPCVKVGREYYYPYAAITWYHARKYEALEGQRPPALEEARARRELAQAQLAEIELAKARGELVTHDIFESELGLILDGLRARLLNLPGRMAPRLLGARTVPEMELRLEEAVHEAMIDLTREADDLEDGVGRYAIDETKTNGRKAAGKSKAKTKAGGRKGGRSKSRKGSRRSK